MTDTAPTFRWTEDQTKALGMLGDQALRHCMLLGGSRSGKSAVICGALVHRALKAPGSRHGILRHRFNAVVNSIGMDTLPAILAKRFPGLEYEVDRSRWIFTLPGKSEIWLFGLDDAQRAEKILGLEFASLFFNECSQLGYEAVTLAMSRLAQKTSLVARAFYDMNPGGRRHWTAQLFIDKLDPVSGSPLSNPQHYSHLRMNPEGNAHNLSPDYLAMLDALPEHKRKRFLLGEFSTDLDNALWTVAMIKHAKNDTPIVRTVVSVDPSASKSREDLRNDAVGIVVASKHENGGYSIRRDATMRGGPDEWVNRAIDLYDAFEADCILAETNGIGGLVHDSIRVRDRSIPVRGVHSRQKKHVRAEPVSLLYRDGLVVHEERFADLEDQLLSFSLVGYSGSGSPDWADAAIHALLHLSQKSMRVPSFVNLMTGESSGNVMPPPAPPRSQRRAPSFVDLGSPEPQAPSEPQPVVHGGRVITPTADGKTYV